MNLHATMLSKVKEYLSFRRRAGFALSISGEQLLSFARFADCTGYRGPLTVELASRWALANRHGLQLTAARRIEVLRSFARYCQTQDPKTEIPPVRLFGPGHRRLTPHIYTEQEIAALLAASARLHPVKGLRPITCATIFGLLSATGLRISEATALRRQDVDLRGSLLHIHQAKFGKSRLVPLHPTTTRTLQRYARRRGLAASSTPSSSCAAGFVGAPAEGIATRVSMTCGTHSCVGVYGVGMKMVWTSTAIFSLFLPTSGTPKSAIPTGTSLQLLS